MKRLFAASLCLLVLSVVPQATAEPVRIPFKLVADHLIVVRGSWGALQNLNLLLDTGAVPSVVHPRVAARLQASGIAQTYSQLRDGFLTERVTAAGFRIGAVSLGSMTLRIVNLTNIERECGIPIDAIIGIDVLRQVGTFTIDYKSRVLEFGTSLQNGLIVPFDADSAPYIAVLLNANGRTLRVILDTGANRINLFEDRAADALMGLRTVATNSNVNIAGRYDVREVEMRLALGETAFGDCLVVVSQVSQRSFPNFQGLLGPAALGIKKLSVDFEHNFIVFQR